MADGTCNERWLDAFATPVAGGTRIELHSGGKVAESGKSSLFGDDVEVRWPLDFRGTLFQQKSSAGSIQTRCLLDDRASIRPLPAARMCALVAGLELLSCRAMSPVFNRQIHDFSASCFWSVRADCLHSITELLATITGS